jgi:hypothetical protein
MNNYTSKMNRLEFWSDAPSGWHETVIQVNRTSALLALLTAAHGQDDTSDLKDLKTRNKSFYTQLQSMRKFESPPLKLPDFIVKTSTELWNETVQYALENTSDENVIKYISDG